MRPSSFSLADEPPSPISSRADEQRAVAATEGLGWVFASRLSLQLKGWAGFSQADEQLAVAATEGAGLGFRKQTSNGLSLQLKGLGWVFASRRATGWLQLKGLGWVFASRRARGCRWGGCSTRGSTRTSPPASAARSRASSRSPPPRSRPSHRHAPFRRGDAPPGDRPGRRPRRRAGEGQGRSLADGWPGPLRGAGEGRGVCG